MKTIQLVSIIGCLVLSSPAFAQKKHSHEHHHHGHRSHGAHQHGVGELSLAFEGMTGNLELRAPSESFWGFEHAAKTEAQKKTVAAAKTKLEQELAAMIKFDAALGCSFEKGDVKEHREKKNSKHSEIEVRSKITCTKSPLGTTLVLSFTSAFPQLKTVNTTVLVDSLQKSVKVSGAETSLDLKE
ncbi:MAG: DUF2796 domain-containing protein [Bdellovibrionaceae bacterium]|nr:DUF2796 domain-containing protein [Pseudobdellovibrionaceae bacterium]